ncbi:MAG: hypothetical protein LBP83_08445 [Dysgonamonadaceae bacterium]|jgi:hypothetical protein|nr:hypothetical protein [Dysgonamonadaceae bacterium]
MYEKVSFITHFGLIIKGFCVCLFAAANSDDVMIYYDENGVEATVTYKSTFDSGLVVMWLFLVK